MKGPGLFWMLQVAVGLSMAGPMVIIGVDFVRTGEPLFGVFFFAVGLIALFAPNYFVRRIGGPRTWIRRRLNRRRSSDGDTDSEEQATPSSTADTASSPGLLERLRQR